MTTRDFLNSLPDSQFDLKRVYLSHMSGCIAQEVYHKPCPRSCMVCIDCIFAFYK